MTFLAPFYLLLGLAAGVPLLLHLLRRHVSTRIEFPAARYLQRAEQEHSRSLRLRNLLLMLLRVLVVLALALAAARPFLPGVGVGHGATGVAVVLDNSLSTTAMSNGAPVFERLRAAVRALLLTTAPTDRLWLATADGMLHAGTRASLLAELARTSPIESAGDLPLAVRRAAAAAQSAGLPAHVVAIATDGQRSAWAGARVEGPLAVFVPPGNPPRNRAVLFTAAEPQRWTPRGAVIARIQSGDSIEYRVVLGERTLARGVAARDEPVMVRVAPAERGWQPGRVEVEPDDYAADDARHFAVWIGGAPAVNSTASAGTFVAAAVGALIADGRATPGRGVEIASADAAIALPALLLPPADPIRLGAANRALARLGVPWRFGALETSPAIARGGRLDGVSVHRRYRLVPDGAARSDTLGVVSGDAWVVAGHGYVLTASRLDPDATNLPVRAVFVPWLADLLALRLGAPSTDLGAPIDAAPRAPMTLPVGADALESATGARRTLSAGAVSAPDERGVWFVLRAGRRIGAVVVNAPPGESALTRWSARALASRIASRGSDARAAETPGAWLRAVFAAGSLRPAIVPLLLLVLLLFGAEAIVVRASRSPPLAA